MKKKKNIRKLKYIKIKDVNLDDKDAIIEYLKEYNMHINEINRLTLELSETKYSLECTKASYRHCKDKLAITLTILGNIYNKDVRNTVDVLLNNKGE